MHEGLGRLKPGATVWAVAALVAALIAAVLVIGRISVAEIQSAYGDRLKAGLSSFEMLLNQKLDTVDRELSRIARDDALKVTLALDMREQLHHYLAEQFEGSALDFIELASNAGDSTLESVEAGPDLAPESGVCTEDYRLLVGQGRRLYLVRRFPVTREGETLAVVCGGVELSRAELLAYLRQKLDADPFVIGAGGQSYLLDESLSGFPESAEPGRLMAVRAGGEPAVAMTGLYRRDGRMIQMGLVVHGKQLGGRITRLVQVFLIGFLVIGAAAFVAWRNFSLQRRARKALERAHELASVTLSSIGDSVMTTDTNGWINYMNAAAVELTGYSIADLQGKPWNTRIRLVEKSSDKPMDPVMASLRLKRPVRSTSDTNLVHKHGQTAVQFMVTPMFEADQVSGAVIVLHNTSHERKLRDELIQRVNTDQLTGLLNRGAFCQRVESALLEARNSDSHHAVLFLDLDRFKAVNDSCGHQAGDLLLKQVGTVLQRCLRREDVLARLGGDEFGVLLWRIDEAGTVAIAEKLLTAINEYRFVFEQKLFALGVSIGVAMVEADSESFEAVFHAADTACLGAKEKGRNRIEVFSGQFRSSQGQEIEWAPRIREALRHDKLFLYVQPVKAASEVAARREAGIWEVLVRMLDDQAQVVAPSVFLPVAERYGLMPEIDRWVIDHVFRDEAIRFVTRAGERNKSLSLMSINVSSASISQPEFLPWVMDRMTAYEVCPANICFELSETTLSAHLDQASQFIEELSALGCRFMIDDFGVGMTSFAHLKHLKVDFLKIDSSAVRNTQSDPIDRSLVKAVIDVARAMGIRTVAEFVESEEIVVALRALGIDYLQGFAVGRPFPLDDFRQRLLRVVA